MLQLLAVEDGDKVAIYRSQLSVIESIASIFYYLLPEVEVHA